jgi:LacI family transcriptional regulator
MANKTIYDVAHLARVSMATVSRVVNNPDIVRPETRERVFSAIKELGYRPNVIARNLAQSKTTTVGVLVSDVTRSNISELLGGILDIARKYNYSVKLFSIGGEQNFLESVQIIVSEQVNGLLCLDDELNDEEIAKMKEILAYNSIPFVFGNSHCSDPEIPSVSVDYEKASFELVSKLVKDGRKNIYFLSTKRRYQVNMEKENGYLRACREYEIEPHILLTTGDITVAANIFQDFFRNHTRIDAAIGVRDSIVVYFNNVAKEFGYKIPEDIALIGFQNSKYALLSQPQLTSLDVPIYDIGAVAMRLLTKLMDEEVKGETKVVLPYSFVERNSTR